MGFKALRLYQQNKYYWRNVVPDPPGYAGVQIKPISQTTSPIIESVITEVYSRASFNTASSMLSASVADNLTREDIEECKSAERKEDEEKTVIASRYRVIVYAQKVR